jgi:hypothetical protein
MAWHRKVPSYSNISLDIVLFLFYTAGLPKGERRPRPGPQLSDNVRISAFGIALGRSRGGVAATVGRLIQPCSGLVIRGGHNLIIV